MSAPAAGASAPAADEPTDPGLSGRTADFVTGLLPNAVHENVAAVLLVDLDAQRITYANETAGQLAPEIQLPAGVDDWSAAAGLHDFAGSDLPADDPTTADGASSSRSLLRVAAGEPALGEAVTAARRSTSTEAREPLWVLGLPLTGGPDELRSMALLVFLPMRDAAAVADAQQSAAELRERALGATRISFTISDPRQPDNPLVWVNPAFTETTGYELADVVGRNCRFLQGPDTDRRVVTAMHDAFARGEPINTTLLNYRKDGTPFWNQLTVSPVFDGSGAITHFVGVQADVSDRVYAERTREAALTRAEQARSRLALVASFTRDLASARDADTVRRLVADAVVPRLGDRGWVSVLAGSRLHTRSLGDAAVSNPADVADDLLGPILRGERDYLLVEDPSWLPDGQVVAPSDPAAEAPTTLLAVPVVARNKVRGAVTLVRDPHRPTISQDDVVLAQDLAGRAGLALDNIELYERHRQASETLQRGLRPTLPSLPGLRVSAAYLPAAEAAEVGGDWYDAFVLADGDVGFAVGDVMGHDLAAAPSMGELRAALRAYAWPGGDPQAVLDQIDALITGLQTAQLATCFYGRLHLLPDAAGRPGSGGAELTYANAGHPAPVVLHADGRVEPLPFDGGRLLGIRGLSGGRRVVGPPARMTVPRAATILCFSDGLVDAFGTDVELATAGLHAAIAELAPLEPADLLVALTERVEIRRDDVTILAVSVR